MKRLLLTTAAVVVVDQATKVAAAIGDPASANRGLIGNTGGLAGIVPFEGLGMLVPAAVTLVVFVYIGSRLVERGRSTTVIIGLLAGGAVGNLIDRAVLGYVRDFIWTPWLVVNVADLILFVGAISFAVYAIRSTPISGRAT